MCTEESTRNEGAKGVVRYLKEHDIRIPVFAKALAIIRKRHGSYSASTASVLPAAYLPNPR
jgi:hypothetical protein